MLKSSYNLFVDDDRYPYNELRGSKESNGTSAFSYTKFRPFYEKEWIIVRSFEEFVSEVKEKVFLIWFLSIMI